MGFETRTQESGSGGLGLPTPPGGEVRGSGLSEEPRNRRRRSRHPPFSSEQVHFRFVCRWGGSGFKGHLNAERRFEMGLAHTPRSDDGRGGREWDLRRQVQSCHL